MREGGSVARQRTVGQYRLIDLGLWLVILAVFENIVVRAAVRWFPSEPYWVSIVPAVTAIVMMRWGAWGLIHACIGGLVTCIAAGGNHEWYVIYGAGNLLACGILVLFRWIGKDNIQSDTIKSLFCGLLLFLLMQAGKALVSLFFGWKLANTIGMFASEVVTLLFTEVILWIVRRLDGVFEDQRQYLQRVWRERETERGDKQ